MDLSTKYLGLSLKTPIIVGASPFGKDVDGLKKAEEAGASGIVMYSLFQEQIEHDQRSLDHFLSTGESYAESITYFPELASYPDIDAQAYLKQLEKVKKSVSIPVFGSLNGISKGGWSKYAKRMEDAGASAVELNIFYVPTDPKMKAEDVENMYIESLQAVKESVKIPVAIKLGAFFTSLTNFAKRLDGVGVDGLVLFNRFFCPDIDLDSLEVVPQLFLSEQNELRLPLRWIAVLSGKVKADLCGTSGIHEGADVLKMLLAGASCVQITSVLLKNGVNHISTMINDMTNWMSEREYQSVSQMVGSMSYRSVAQPAAYERANYMKTLQSFEQ